LRGLGGGHAVGENIRSSRKKAGLSLDSLSAASGVAKSTIWEIERGDKNPRIYTLLRLANGLGMGIGEMLHVNRDPLTRRERHVLMAMRGHCMKDKDNE
jgi:transcriptional regulator with XRE-family HTH domain